MNLQKWELFSGAPDTFFLDVLRDCNVLVADLLVLFDILFQ